MGRRMGSKERAAHCLLSLPLACYHAVNDLVGGIGALAGAWGRNPQVLQSKLNPNCDTHHVNLSDLEQIIVTTQDERILQSICALYGAGYFILPKSATDETGLLEKSATLQRELGELMQTVSAALQDGRVDTDEVAALDRALMEFTSAGAGLIAHAKRIGGVE